MKKHLGLAKAGSPQFEKAAEGGPVSGVSLGRKVPNSYLTGKEPVGQILQPLSHPSREGLISCWYLSLPEPNRKPKDKLGKTVCGNQYPWTESREIGGDGPGKSTEWAAEPFPGPSVNMAALYMAGARKWLWETRKGKWSIKCWKLTSKSRLRFFPTT